VFVHGWVVSHTNTYGGLPERLATEAAIRGIELSVKEIFLGRYISFHDEVQISDVARAFGQAIKDQLSNLLKNNGRFACITHSTGGPIIRDWWHHLPKNIRCPMSHLIMLAPANNGSALAQLGKGRLSRMKSWFDGVEPGQGLLNWLELGSNDAWQLNHQWVDSDEKAIGAKGVFPFVLTGQSIDRSFYDHLNTYTGEIGSDGVVRLASANLQINSIDLEQKNSKLTIKAMSESPNVALKILNGKSHSGKQMGIMASVTKGIRDKKSSETIQCILDCLEINTKPQYQRLSKLFAQQNSQNQSQMQIEKVDYLFLPDSHFIHDKCSMVIFRVKDQEGHPIKDFDLILTAGKKSNPNQLPPGFLVDKQRNSIYPNTISYFFNHDLMKGCAEIVDEMGVSVRQAKLGTDKLGLQIIPRPDSGFVHYQACEIAASSELLENIIRVNATTLVDICLTRLVHKNVMTLDKGVKQRSFIRTKPGDDFIN
ncbi:MAG: phospholipase, partial [Gammaproteobacteria bacterium]